MSKRYASWGSDATYRWLWRAALQDAIFAVKNRYNRHRAGEIYAKPQGNTSGD